jgi:hypothetical protein
MISARENNSRANAPNLTKMICTPYYVQFTFLTDVCKRAHHPINGQNAQHKRSTSDTFTTIQNQYQWYGTKKQNLSCHNFMSCLTITSTPFKHPIQTSHKCTLWTDYLKQTAINMMIPLETNAHIYSLTGE